MKTTLALAVAGCFLQLAQSFYLPGIASTTYKEEEAVDLKVNHLTSSKTQLSYEHYKLPFCQPGEIINAAENLGEILTGNRIENTKYELLLLKDETCKVGCSDYCIINGDYLV
jgi:transmembrane 9 superfamily protein 2/4